MAEYEDYLIREATERYAPWCSDCERDAEDCVCEELSDHFRETVGSSVGRSDGDVCSCPAPSEFPLQLMDRPTTFGEYLERHGDHLPLPNSFQEWLDSNQDSIIQ